MRRRISGRAGRLLPAAAALAAAWIVAPAAVPLYDGIGFPDEPYRYVDPPAGYRKTPPPTRAFGAAPGGVPAGAGLPDGRGASTQDLNVKSAEQGPQVEIYVAKGGLTGPASARSYQIAADPVAPGNSGSGNSGSGSAPARIDGDVYRVRIACSSVRPTDVGPAPTAAACPVTIVRHGSNRSAWIALRATSARRPPPIFLYRPTPDTAWRSLPTDRAGNDIYATTLRGAGDYALTFPADASGGARSAPSSDSSGGRPTTVIVLVIVLAALAVTVGAIRFVRTRG